MPRGQLSHASLGVSEENLTKLVQHANIPAQSGALRNLHLLGTHLTPGVSGPPWAPPTNPGIPTPWAHTPRDLPPSPPSGKVCPWNPYPLGTLLALPPPGAPSPWSPIELLSLHPAWAKYGSPPPYLNCPPLPRSILGPIPLLLLPSASCV